MSTAPQEPTAFHGPAAQVSAIFRDLRRGTRAVSSPDPVPPASTADLIRDNYGFVVVIARRYRGIGIPLEDLINIGNLGLVEAARRFDPSRRAKFVTYAVWWIRKMICEAVSRESAIVFVPPYQRRLARRLAGAATPAEPIREVHLDADWNNEDRGQRHELPATDETDPELATIRAQDLERLRAALNLLPERERLVLQHRFGLDGGPELTLKDVGQALGISRERVRQIQQKALGLLGKRVAGGRKPPRQPARGSCRVADEPGAATSAPRGRGARRRTRPTRWCTGS